MSGYNNPPPGGYGNPPPGSYSYGAPPPPQQPYTAPPYASPAPPPSHVQSHHHQPSQQPPYAQPSAPSAPYKPPKDGHGHGGSAPYASPPAGYGSGPYASPASGYGAPPYPPPPAGYGSPFAALVPSAFPPGTDPSVVACFQLADQDGSGFIDDKELQRALSSYNQSFSLRTVHLLMYLFTNSNAKKIGPKEFTSLFYSLQSWRGIFEKFDRDRSGRIDLNELRDALLSLGFSVSTVVLDLLVSKFDKSGGRSKSIEYDNFIECCLTVKGLTEKFKEKDTMYSGSATFSYETFMLTVLPFIIA